MSTALWITLDAAATKLARRPDASPAPAEPVVGSHPARLAGVRNIAAAGRWVVQSSRHWRDYFQRNARALLDIPWQRGAELTDSERDTIAASVQEFQLGEQSDGHNFLGLAAAHAAEKGDADYLEALRSFIGEEQRHASALGRFLQLAGVPLLRRSLGTMVFRWLRRGGGLDRAIAVVLVPELLACVYYAALRRATGSTVLRRLCEQILRDEVAHLRFGCERLALLRKDWPRSRVRVARGLHCFLFGGTCLVLWCRHRRVLQAGGLSFTRFWTAAWRRMNEALRRMEPRHYTWPARRHRRAFIG